MRVSEQSNESKRGEEEGTKRVGRGSLQGNQYFNSVIMINNKPWIKKSVNEYKNYNTH